MTDSPRIFIESPVSAVIPVGGRDEYDPITGRGPNTTAFTQQNPGVLEHDNARPPDYSISIFSTVNDNIYTLFQNNIILPVEYNTVINTRGINKYISGGTGVYIIERYSIYGLFGDKVPELLDYYVATNDISYSEDAIELIKNTIRTSVNPKGRISRLIIRLITYIDLEILKENQYTYVNGPGVVIIHGDISNEIQHPYSPAYLEESLINPTGGESSISLDITIVDDDNKSYYFMVGNDVKTIRPLDGKKSSVLPNGGTITTRRGESVVDEKFIKMEDFEDSGFYRSKVLCKNNGNKSLVIDEAKYEIDLEKAKLELERVKELNSKLLMERDARYDCAELDSDRREMDFEYSAANKKLDLSSAIQKHRVDTDNRVADIHVSRYKTEQDILKSNADVRRAHELHNLKKTDGIIKLCDTIFKILK